MLKKQNVKVCPHLFIRFRAAEAKDEEVAVGVCAGETLPIRGELAIENSSMTLALDLNEKHKNHSQVHKFNIEQDEPSTKVILKTVFFLIFFTKYLCKTFPLFCRNEKTKIKKTVFKERAGNYVTSKYMTSEVN